jgi:hypothetical protein
MTPDDVLDDLRMREGYGGFYSASPQVPFDPNDVPQSLRILIPYARFWGVTDDLKREQLVQSASPSIGMNLKAVVARFDAGLDDWLAGPESTAPRPSAAYLAFSAMRMAADFV